MEYIRREKIGIYDIEKLHLLTQEVLKLYEPKITLYDTNYDDIAHVVELLEPIRAELLKSFRDDGTELLSFIDSEFYAGEDLTDDYLMSFFATKLRDEKRITEAQNHPKCYYLLLRGYPQIADGDEYIGVYTDIRKLRRVYAKATMNLENENADNGENFVLKICRLDENKFLKNDYQGELVDPADLWGEFLAGDKLREFRFDPSIQRYIENILTRRGIDYNIVERDGCKKVQVPISGCQFHKIIIRARCEETDYRMYKSDIRISPVVHERELFDELVEKETCGDGAFSTRIIKHINPLE